MKRYIIFTVYVTCIFSLLSAPSVHAAGEFTVQFERAPLFSEASFMSGDAIVRWIRATNNLTSENAQVAILVNNLTDPENLSSVLDVEVREGSIVHYHGTLHELSDAGLTNLSEVMPGSTSQYDVSVTFVPDAGNDYQGVTLGFDISIGMRSGTDEEYETFTSVGGNGGGGTVPTPTLSPTPTPSQAPIAWPLMSPTLPAGGQHGGAGSGGSGVPMSGDLSGQEISQISPLATASEGTSSQEQKPENNLLASIGSFFGDIDLPWWLLLLIPAAYLYWRWRK